MGGRRTALTQGGGAVDPDVAPGVGAGGGATGGGPALAGGSVLGVGWALAGGAALAGGGLLVLGDEPAPGDVALADAGPGAVGKDAEGGPPAAAATPARENKTSVTPAVSSGARCPEVTLIDAHETSHTASLRHRALRARLTWPNATGYVSTRVQPVIDLAPGADHDPLARRLAERVRSALLRDGPRDEFLKMRGSVGIVADDVDTALTLRFDFGRLTIHEGLIGVPTVTVRGRVADLDALSSLSLANTGMSRLAEAGRAAAELGRALRARRLKIYGLMSHPRLVVRLFRVLGHG